MHVVIVGAGPSGLTLALLLSKANIQVTLLDSESTIDSRPRAAHYASSAIQVLRAAGVLDDVRAEGFIPDTMSWRKIDGTRIATVKNFAMREKSDALTVLPLHLLGKVLLRHVLLKDNIRLKWNSKVVDVGQDEEKAWAVVRSSEDGLNEVRVEGDYVVGCDGGNSQVRRSLFGKEFPGKTWDAQVVATDVYYPLDKFGYDDTNNIIHPTDWYMAAKITKDGLWRVSYGEDTKLTHDQVVANQPAKYERMLPGNPKPGDYKLTNVGPYKIHQRIAPKFRVGRVCLAADAAHLCNPFGGMGLTGGLVDVGGLAECLAGIATGQVDDSILDKYSDIRRDIWEKIINPFSSDNFLRVSATDPETALQKDLFLGVCAKIEEDLSVRKQYEEGAYAICHDFKQYYRTSP